MTVDLVARSRGSVTRLARSSRRSARVTRRPRNERQHVQVTNDLAQLAPDHDAPVRDTVCARHEALGAGPPKAARGPLQVRHDGAVLRRACPWGASYPARGMRPASGERAGLVLEVVRRLRRSRNGYGMGRFGCEAVSFRLDMPARVLVEEVAPEQRVEGQRAPLAGDGAGGKNRAKVEVGEDIERDLERE